MKFRAFDIKIHTAYGPAGVLELQNIMNTMYEQRYELMDKVVYNLPQGEGYNDEVHIVAIFKYSGAVNAKRTT